NAINLGKKVMVWGSGYDWAEKDFIDLLESSESPPYLFSDSTEFKLNEISLNGQFFGVRGPLTYKLLEKSFIDMSNINISGDPCFLLKPKPMYEYTPILKITDDKPIVAINWGTCLNKIYGNNEHLIESTLTKVCKSLIASGYRLYIYVMWNEDIAPCTNLYNSIDDPRNVTLDTNLYCAGQILTLLEKCVFSINLKLHANIISSVARTPFICLGYRFKSMDFVKSINCEDLIVFTDDLNLKSSIEDKIDYISNNYDLITNKIDEEINKYNSFLEIPFVDNLF
ncbi:MAG: polysaccharide pyruvyl transferase family protein, partial [Paraclostridium sp.]